MIKYKDLEYVLAPVIEIGTYNPKSGSPGEVVVVCLHVKDSAPIRDIKRFIEFMAIDNLVDVSTRDIVNEDGYYIIFVELFLNKSTWDDIVKVMHELGSISGFTDWNIRVYKHEARNVPLEKIKKKVKHTNKGKKLTFKKGGDDDRV